MRCAVQVHYTFQRTQLLQEPFLVVGAFYLLFILVIIYVRLDFSITKVIFEPAQTSPCYRVGFFPPFYDVFTVSSPAVHKRGEKMQKKIKIPFFFFTLVFLELENDHHHHHHHHHSREC